MALISAEEPHALTATTREPLDPGTLEKAMRPDGSYWPTPSQEERAYRVQERGIMIGEAQPDVCLRGRCPQAWEQHGAVEFAKPSADAVRPSAKGQRRTRKVQSSRRDSSP